MHMRLDTLSSRRLTLFVCASQHSVATRLSAECELSRRSSASSLGPSVVNMLKTPTTNACSRRSHVCAPSRRVSSVAHRRPVRTQAIAELQPFLDTQSTLTATYASLGLAAASFAGTFFVAPRFKDAFKEATDWKTIYTDLVDSGVKSITAEDAYLRGKRGTAVLDVRLMSKWEQLRPEGSINIPLYLPIKGWGLAANIRRAGFAFFGIYGTELNTTFAEEVAAVVPKGREIVVICESGGSLENKSGTKNGFQSRSLKAAWYLQQQGFSRVTHVKGGLGQWMRDDLPVEEGRKEVPAPATAGPAPRARSKSGSTISEKLLAGTRSLRR